MTSETPHLLAVGQRPQEVAPKAPSPWLPAEIAVRPLLSQTSAIFLDTSWFILDQLGNSSLVNCSTFSSNLEKRILPWELVRFRRNCFFCGLSQGLESRPPIKGSWPIGLRFWSLFWLGYLRKMAVSKAVIDQLSNTPSQRELLDFELLIVLDWNIDYGSCMQEINDLGDIPPTPESSSARHDLVLQ